jgi:lipoprotein-releasing system ATP-binding protein
MAFLEVNNLTRAYTAEGERVTALADVAFGLERGASLAVCGPSGAGKSTLLNLLGGLDKPTSGSVLLDGRDLFKLGDAEEAGFRQKNLGFIFQFHHLLQDFDVLENVMMPLLIQGEDKRRARSAAMGFLEKVGLCGKERRHSRELSGGEQQRVAIARALVHGPKLVLADEPTGNLDHANGEAVFELLCGLNHDLQATLVVVTHNEVLAKKLKHYMHLESGRVLSFA